MPLTELHVLSYLVELFLRAVLVPHQAKLVEPSNVEVGPSTKRHWQKNKLNKENIGPLGFGVASTNVHLNFNNLEIQIKLIGIGQLKSGQSRYSANGPLSDTKIHIMI